MALSYKERWQGQQLEKLRKKYMERIQSETVEQKRIILQKLLEATSASFENYKKKVLYEEALDYASK